MHKDLRSGGPGGNPGFKALQAAHTAIAGVLAHRDDTYAIDGTGAREYFAHIKTGKAVLDDSRLVNGVLKYDHFALSAAQTNGALRYGDRPTDGDRVSRVALVIRYPATHISCW